MGTDFNVNVNVKTNGKEVIDSLERQIEKLKNQSVKIKVDIEKNSDLSNLMKQIKSIEKQTIKLKVATSGGGNNSTVNSVKKDFTMLKNLANEIGQKKIKIAGLDNSKNSNQISALNTQLKRLESDYNTLYSTFGKKLNTDQLGQLNNIFGKASDKVAELSSKSKDLANNISKISKPFNQLDATIASNKTITWLNANTKAAKDYGSSLKELARKQKEAISYEELKDYTRQVNEIKSTAALQGKTGVSWASDFGQAVKQIGQFVGVYGIIQNIAFQIPKQLFKATRDVNAAQIELTKVSSAPTSQLSNYWNEATDSAKKYGATISDVISSTADWSRLGYSLDNAKRLSDATTLLQNVGDNMTQESSAQGLISTLRGFKMEADEVESIVDKVNEVANTQPIDTSGLFEGLEHSASSMSAANNTLEQTIALITAANSVVQDPASVGTAFKTISMRIRGAETDLEQAGLDTEGMAKSTAKLREEILALSGIDIMINDNTFKSTYDILDELASKWKNLTDIQQASVTELIAGKRQGNVVSALMSNFDIARGTLNTAENNSSGSAQKELENWNKGIEASIAHFKAQFQELSTVTLDSGFVKGFIDSGTSALDILTQIIDKVGILQSLIGGVALTKGLFSFVKNFDNSANMVRSEFNKYSPIFLNWSIIAKEAA